MDVAFSPPRNISTPYSPSALHSLVLPDVAEVLQLLRNIPLRNHRAPSTLDTLQTCTQLMSGFRSISSVVGSSKVSDADPAVQELDKSVIDVVTFKQILEMDDDPNDREFSRAIVYEFFNTAETIIEEMRETIEKKDLLSLSSLGEFMKGSSATLGLIKMRDNCEKIQAYGRMRDEQGNSLSSEDEALRLIPEAYHQLQEGYKKIEGCFKQFYGSGED